MGALLLAEAGRVAGQRQRQLGAVQRLVDKAADHAVLGRSDQVQVLALDLVHHGVHLREGHDALHHVAVDHKGRDHVGKALVDHKVAGVGQHRLVQAGDIAQQVVEAVARHAAGGVQVDAVKALHDVHMVGDGVVGHHRLAKTLHLDVMAVVGADGHAGVDHLGDLVHDLLDAGLQLILAGLQLFQPVGLGGDLLFDLLGLGGLGRVLLGLAHQRADLLGQLVAVGAQAVALADDGAVLGVQRDDLVHQRQLGVLEFLFDVLLDLVGMLPDKTDIQHGFPLLVVWFGAGLLARSQKARPSSTRIVQSAFYTKRIRHFCAVCQSKCSAELSFASPAVSGSYWPSSSA